MDTAGLAEPPHLLECPFSHLPPDALFLKIYPPKVPSHSERRWTSYPTSPLFEVPIPHILIHKASVLTQVGGSARHRAGEPRFSRPVKGWVMAEVLPGAKILKSYDQTCRSYF